MGDQDLTRSAIWSALAALVVFLIPSVILERFVVATGISSVIPAAAPPLGTTASLLLALIVFVIGISLAALLGRNRDDWETDDSYAGQADPLPAAEQVTTSPVPLKAQSVAQPVPEAGDDLHARLSRIEAALATLSGQIQVVAKAGPGPELGKTLRSVQALLRNPPTDPVLLDAVRSMQGGQSESESVLARIGALEARIDERFAEINDRLPTANRGVIDSHILPLPKLPARRPTGAAAQRISRTLAEIRRSIGEPTA